MAKQEDWIRVILVKEGNEPEEMPVSFVEDMGEYCIGILEMEPAQDFGYHKGDKIGYFPYTDDQGTTVLISDMNPSRRLTAADLEGGELLKEAGVSYENVVKTSCFLADMNNFGAFNEVYARYFTQTPPARSCVAVKTLPKNVLCEVEVIAYLK